MQKQTLNFKLKYNSRHLIFTSGIVRYISEKMFKITGDKVCELGNFTSFDDVFCTILNLIFGLNTKSSHIVLTLFSHLVIFLIMGTSNLINSKLINVLQLSIASRRGFHLVYMSITMVTWGDMVLRAVDLPYTFFVL